MTVQGVDYSSGRPGGAALAAAGKVFAARYVPYPGAGKKGIDAAERDDLRANGIAIAIVFESTAGRMFDGWPAGQWDAKVSADAMDALGFPRHRPIFFACDVDTQPSMLALVDDYLRGAAAVIGLDRVGIYGEFEVVEHCHAVGTATWFWQTAAWSDGQLSSWRHIYQYLNGQTLNGAAVDFDDGEGADFGQWSLEEDHLDARSTIATYCTREEIEALLGGTLTEGEALAAAHVHIDERLAHPEAALNAPLADALVSHLVIHPGPTAAQHDHPLLAGHTGLST